MSETREQTGPDLRTLLTEATDASEKAAEAPAEREKPASATDTPEATETHSGDRPRGADGKFIPKTEAGAETEGEEPDAEDGEGEPAETEEKAEKPEKPEAASSVEVPQHWPQADKDMVAALPSEHRAMVVERFDVFKRNIERGFTPKLERAAEVERQFGGASEIFAPYQEALRQSGRTPSDYIRAWASVEQGFLAGLQDAQQGRLNERGATLVANLIRQYQVDPGVVARLLQGQAAVEGGAQQSGVASVPPELDRRLRSVETMITERAAADNAAKISSAQRQIDVFANEKDSAGNLLHPHFATLEQEITRLARADQDAGMPLDLADLYERASYANRETRQALLASREGEVKRKAAAERKARAAAAQRASSSVTGSASGQAPAPQSGKTRSLREELEAAANEEDEAA